MSGSRRREGPAERRSRRAAVDDPAVVLEAAARYLEARSRSVGELRRHLVGAGYRSELVEAAIERLMALRLLDDVAFARAWVASRDRAHPRGERALRLELRQKGLDEATIASALGARGEPDPLRGEPAPSGDGTASSEPDEAAARRLLAKRSGALARVAEPRLRRSKAFQLLARSGFDSELAGRLAGELAREVEPEVEPEGD